MGHYLGCVAMKTQKEIFQVWYGVASSNLYCVYTLNHKTILVDDGLGSKFEMASKVLNSRHFIYIGEL